MFALERQKKIMDTLSRDGSVFVSKLSSELGVTEETIRRDLEKLDNEGIATKTYGGAVANKNLNVDLPSSVRKRTNVELKKSIAKVYGVDQKNIFVSNGSDDILNFFFY